MIEQVRGLCPNNDIQLRIQKPTGGSITTSNWYVVWFKKNSGVFNYNSPKCDYPFAYRKKLRIDFLASLTPFYALEVPSLSYLDNNGIVPDTLLNFINRMATNLQGYGRVINTGADYIEIYFNTSDFLSTGLPCNIATIVYNIYNLPYPSGTVSYNGFTGCCGTIVSVQTITGWEPIAGAVGLDTITLASPYEGEYMAEVTDYSGTTDYDTIKVERYDTICSLEGSNPSCNGANDGSIIVNIPFWMQENIVFQWTDKDKNPISNSKDLFNLTGGTYCLEITDGNGCTSTCCITLEEPTDIVATLNITQPTCVLCGTPEQFGKVYVKISGGNVDCKVCDNSVINNKSKSGYEYQLNPLVNTWTPVELDDSIYFSALKAGSYKLKIKDCNCCFKEYDIVISVPKIIAKVTTVDSSCPKSNSGKICIENLVVPTYPALINIYNPVTYTSIANLATPFIKPTAVVITPVSGGIEVNLPGKYCWDNLAQGTYVVEVFDSNKSVTCSSRETVVINEPNSIQISYDIVKIKCGAFFNLDVNPIGGTYPYVISVSKPGTSSIINDSGEFLSLQSDNLSPYTINVTDANGCTSSTTFIVPNQPTMSVVTGYANPTCNSSKDGYIDVLITGGKGPYKIVLLMRGSLIKSNVCSETDCEQYIRFDNLRGDSYTITVTDAEGCIVTTTVTLLAPNAITLNGVVITQIDCQQCCNASLLIDNIAGGVPSYNLSLSKDGVVIFNMGSPNGLGPNLINLGNLCEGLYEFVVEDSVGCIKTLPFTIYPCIKITIN